MRREDYEKLKALAAKKDSATYSHVEDGAYYIAEALNLLDAANTQLKMAFELNPDWDDMLEISLRDIRAELGGCLSALNTWWSDLYNEDGTQKE